jgi:hypothetical protein
MSNWGAQVRGRLDGRRSSAGFISIGVATVVTVASLAVAVGSPVKSSLERLLNGDTWLSSQTSGQVELANGSSAKVDLRLNLGLPGHDLQLIKVGDRTVVYDATTGALSNLDVADLTLGTGGVPGTPGTVDVEPLGPKVAVIDRPPGRVDVEDPMVLKPVASKTLQPNLTRGVTDSHEHLWIADGDSGSVYDLHAAAGAKGAVRLLVGGVVHVAQGPDQLGLYNDHPVVLEPQQGAVEELDGDHVSQHIDVPIPSGATPLLPQFATGSVLPVAVNPGGRVDLISGGHVVTAQLPAGATYQTPVGFGGRAYVPDPQHGKVYVLGADGQQVSSPISLAPGSLDVKIDAGRLWIDGTDGTNAVVVSPDGTQRNVVKTQGNALTVGHHDPATPAVAPAPLPAPHFTPASAVGAAPSGLLGNGSSPLGSGGPLPTQSAPTTPPRTASPSTTSAPPLSSSSSSTSTTIPKPGQPTLVSGPTGGTKSITFQVSCDASCLNGGKLLGYQPNLVPAPAGGQPAMLPVSSGNPQSYTLGNLDVGTRYNVQLAAVTNGGTGQTVSLGAATTFGKAAVTVAMSPVANSLQMQVTPTITSSDTVTPACSLTVVDLNGQSVVKNLSIACSGAVVGVPLYATTYTATVTATNPEGATNGSSSAESAQEALDADATANFGTCPGTAYCGPSSSIWPAATGFKTNGSGEIAKVNGGTTAYAVCYSLNGSLIDNASYGGDEQSTTWFKVNIPNVAVGYMNQLWFAGRGGASTNNLPPC